MQKRARGLLRVGPGDGARHTVAFWGLGAADGDDVQAVGPGLEGADDLGSDPHDVPLVKVLDLVVEQHSA